jgi:hypothetical protein
MMLELLATPAFLSARRIAPGDLLTLSEVSSSICSP